MEALGYVRVSTEEQAREGVSLAAQEARLRAYCTAAGLTLVDIMRDEGVSASKPLEKRPAGLALLRALARKQARHVVVVTLDRMFRSTVDCLSTVQIWDRAGIGLHLVDHGGQSIATATAVGRMFLTMLAGFAEMERRLNGERTAAALRHKKGKRQAYSPTPYGFDREGDGLVENATRADDCPAGAAVASAGELPAPDRGTVDGCGCPHQARGQVVRLHRALSAPQ